MAACGSVVNILFKLEGRAGPRHVRVKRLFRERAPDGCKSHSFNTEVIIYAW